MRRTLLDWCLLAATLMLIGCAGTRGPKTGETTITGSIVQMGKDGSYLPPSPDLHLIVFTTPRSEEVKPSVTGAFIIAHHLEPFTPYTIIATDPSQPELGGSITGIQLTQPGEQKDVGYLLLGVPPQDPQSALELKKKVDTGRGDVKPGPPGH